MPFPTESPYDLLGVTPDATIAAITAAYTRCQRGTPAKRAQAYKDLRMRHRKLFFDLLRIDLTSQEDTTLATELADLATQPLVSETPAELLRLATLHELAALDAALPPVVPACPLEFVESNTAYEDVPMNPDIPPTAYRVSMTGGTR